MTRLMRISTHVYILRLDESLDSHAFIDLPGDDDPGLLPPGLILDLRETRTLDEEGLGRLVELKERMHRRDGQLVLLTPSEDLLRQFRYLELVHAFRITDELHDALVTVGGKGRAAHFHHHFTAGA
ncbi:MAG: STAS domain-containing protein [bacterium]|nr:STAS domain-containing protein [bacterium]